MADLGVIGAVVGATLQLVLQNLLPLPIDKINRVWGFKKELTKLEKSLVMLQNFLYDAEVKQVKDKAVKYWMEQLEEVAFQADALLDEFNYQLLGKKVKNQHHGTKKVKNFPSSRFKNLLFSIKMARKIKDLDMKLDAVNKEATKYGLQMAAVGSQQASIAVPDMPLWKQTDSFSDEPDIVGRESDIKKVVDMLVNSSTKETLSIIPIIGMGGLGKTTVARKVFNIEKIKTHFDEHIWVCVSVHWDTVMIFKMILESLTGENVQVVGTRQAVLEKIRQRLKHKTYLLVLDDVWNDDMEKWEDFKNSLLGISHVKGNSIVVTTRKQNFGSMVKTHSSHQLSRLSEDVCWSIIKARASLGIDVPIELEKVGKCIAQRCGGLPLAAKVVGGLLNGKSKDDWLDIFHNRLSYLERDESTIMKILKLSYDHLPTSSFKRCFAYCSIFPQDFQMAREQLIELWMAEGFLQTDHCTNMESAGNIVFYHLLHNSLFQDAEVDDYGNITHCRMHDLVHDLACSVSGSRRTGVKDRGSNDMHRIRYNILESVEAETRSTHQQAKVVCMPFFSSKVSRNILRGFKCLHSLKLSNADIKELPNLIEELIHLRLLDISHTSIKYLPDTVGKLYNLQTLSGNRLIELPSTLTFLISLRHLHIPPIKLPSGVSTLTSLQTLPYYKVGQEKGCGIVELGKLKHLSGKLHIQNLEKVNNREEAKNADLLGKSNIFKLIFEWNKFTRREANDDENVLEGLQPHPNLKSLEICGYKGRKFPVWIMKMIVCNGDSCFLAGLNNLVKMKFTDCNFCEEIPMLGHLPHLKFLELCSLPNVRSIGLSFYGNENCSSSTSSTADNDKRTPMFRTLEKLVVSEMSNLSVWVSVDGASSVFPCLKYLEIGSCPELNSVPNHFPCLEELTINIVGKDFPLGNICFNLSSLQKIEIISLEGLIHLPYCFFENNQNLSSLVVQLCPKLTHLVPCLRGGGASLKKLIVCNCEKLRELPHDLNTLHLLEELFIFSCPKLKSIPYLRGQSQGFTSLRKLTIQICPRFSTLPLEVLESCTSSLVELSLCYLDSFVDLGGVIPCLSRMSRLLELNLHNLPKLVNFPSENISSISSSLQKLFIGGYSNALSLVSFNQFLHCIFQEPHPLKHLRLYGQENWESLPHEIQHLTSLEYLEMRTFKFEALPEWLGNLSSLQMLYIYNCKKLMHMPSKEAMQRLTKLEELYIDRCPLLKERCSVFSITDSEWPKISHIKNVHIYGEDLNQYMENGLSVID